MKSFLAVSDPTCTAQHGLVEPPIDDAAWSAFAPREARKQVLGSGRLHILDIAKETQLDELGVDGHLSPAIPDLLESHGGITKLGVMPVSSFVRRLKPVRYSDRSNDVGEHRNSSAENRAQ
jgi:hypothetical protein